VAFVGPTGAGKSSIAGLIPRFYDPSSGAVLLDGRDVRMFTQKSLRDQVSFVLQDTVLFYGTIWQNIAYGKAPCHPRGDHASGAHCHADEFIDKMPAGYDMLVGERGVTLSGGNASGLQLLAQSSVTLRC